MKSKQKIVVSIECIGYLLIILATYLITVEVPKSDDNISECNDKIERIDNKISRGLMFYIDYKQTELKSRINHLERNSYLTHKVDDIAIGQIEKKIIKSEYFLIEMWSKLYTMDEIAKEDNSINNRSSKVIRTRKGFFTINHRPPESIRGHKIKRRLSINKNTG